MLDRHHPAVPRRCGELYTSLFGWEFENVMPAGEPAKYLIARIRGGDVAAISSQWEGAPTEAVWNTYIWVDDADESAAKAREAGGSSVSEPVDVAEAGRMAVFVDPEGAVFSVWQAREHKGAGVVNQHGGLNFNILKTGDLEIAKRFYGAVFGWTTLDLGSGQFWAMSAYGDYLEARTPGTRAQAAEFGAAGFEEVVAAIAPLSGGDSRASWNVTFGTEDADATAAKAMELGGTVVVPPVERRTRDSRCCVTRRERRLPPRRSCPRTRTSGAPRSCRLDSSRDELLAQQISV